ncbi:MAG: trypsin-like serine protease, partial [Thermoguttaceae bacterium]|nr:trypsin-like serine protease [Thermoguttaceae bacterium]
MDALQVRLLAAPRRQCRESSSRHSLHSRRRVQEVTVNAYSETDFDITFNGDNWVGYDLPDVRVSNNYYSDITGLIDLFKSNSFDIADLNGISNFQKLILRDIWGNKSTIAEIQKEINSSGRASVIRKLQMARDELVDTLSSAIVTTVHDVQTVTSYNSKGAKVGIVVDSNPYKTAQNIQKAFDEAAKNSALYAPITRGYEYNEKTHRFEYTSIPTGAYRADQSYGSMQEAIKAIEVVVEPVEGSTNQFMITFTGASGLTNQDPLIVSAATNAIKDPSTGVYVYKDLITVDRVSGEYKGTTPTQTVKEPSAVFRVNAPEVAEFVIDPEGDVVTDREGNPILASAGRTNQAKPSVAVSNDGSFVIAWVSENSDALQQYNQTDIMARRFTVRGYLPGPGEAGYDPDYQSDFYENGAEGGKLGYTPADDSAAVNKKFFKDPYAFETNDDKNDAAVKTVQCVYPVADAFVVNASLNGVQDDPCVSADKDGNFIVTWTYVAQDNSYFGGIYGRQFNNEAQPTTGDIIFDTSQVSSNYYGPSYVAMSEDGFAVITWNYGTNFYQSILAPYGANFIVDKSLVAANAYGASVSFDYNHRYALAYTQEDAAGAGGTTTLPVTDSYVQVYEIVDTGYEAVSSVSSTTNNDNNNNNNDNNNDDNEVTGVGAASGHSYSLQYAATRILGATRVNAVTAGDQGNPSVGLDADGDMFVAYQGQGIDIQSITAGNLGDLASTDYSKLFIQLKYEDFENNNLVYKHKQFYRGNKYSYEDKNADLIDYIKLALGWGYDEFGDFTDNGGTPIYQISNYDCSDPDNYIRYFLTVAQKEGATYEQLTRLQAVLEALVSALRNNGYDIGYTNYGQTIYTGAVATTTETANANGNDDDSETVTVITDPRVVSGVVSGYRNGSSANFYISFPAEYVASGTISFDIGIASANDNVQTAYDTCETVTFDFGQYFTDGFLTLNGYTNLINDLNSALNSLNICGGDAYSFVVRPLGYDEIDFYSGSVSPIGLYNEQFQYAYSYTENNVTYTGYRTVDSFLGIQITAQGSLHDTPLYIRQNVRNINNTSLKLMNQAVENADYYYYTDLYVDRYGSYGNLQKNPHVANTSNGDVVVVWSMQQDVPVTSRGELYPSIGNSLTDKYSHIYLRAFTESTDTAGPIVTNVSLPNGEKVDDNQTITSAVKDLVVSFSEDMLSMNDAENATAAKDKSYIRLHAVDNPANWSLLRDGVIVAGAIESIDYGLNRSEPFARETVDEDGNPIEQINFGDLAYGTNRYEAVIHFADGLELTDGNYTLVCSSMVQDAARNAIYSQGYAMDGSLSGFDGHDYELDFSVIRLNEALGFEYSQDNFRYNDYIPVVYVNDTDRQGEDGDEYAFVHDAIDKDGDDYGEHLKQVTRSSILDESSDYGPNTAQAVASNSNGDYVVVWTEETRTDNADGGYTVTKTVYARTYRTLYVTGIDGIRTQVVKDNEGKIITVYTDTGTFNANGKQVDENGAEMRPNAAGRFTDPRQASVAMDDRGRFVVVWDQYTFGPGEDGSRDVYMAKYAFNGGQMQINGNASSPTRVNIEDNDDQQYAAVAMDSDGDIVVVWESYGQDGSGWGVFGRRFVTNGMSYGYQNTVQTIQIIGEIDVQGDQLRLEVDGVSEPIYVPLVVEMQTNAENIKKALVATKVFGENDLDVKVNLNGEISIEFKGAYTSAYVDMIKATVINPNNVGNLSTVVANVTMRQIGVEGQEFQVNETTQNNQRFASIGMDRDGAFVVSWTSWGQDLDSEIESNIYARKFASNHLVASNVRSYEEMSTITVDVDDAIDNPNSDNAEVQIISNDNISYHQVYAGDGYESVCYITVGGSLGLDGRITEPDWSGTGSLLTTRKHVLTAAHVVCEEGSNEVVDLEDTPMYCMFETIEGTISIKVADIIVHPTYTGDPINDNCVDLAVIVLETAAPSSLTGYELYTGTDEIGRSFTVVGYGQYGDVSDEEADLADRPSGVKHIARNTYEITGATYSPTVNPNQLMFDFDDGTYANDYIGNYYGIRNLGLGSEEGCQAQGDSGGPGLINGKIAGVVSWGVSPVVPGGGIYSQVRVSSYVDWISAAVLSDVNGGEFLVNTDATIYFAVDDEDDDDNNNNNNNNDDDTVLLTDSWQKGSQIWSSVAMDGNGDFAITWTGYNQDGNGDALTGGSNNGLGGIFMRVFGADGAIYRTDSVNVVVQVNEYTAYDQIHSQIAMAQNGQFVVAYESYQDPSNDKNSDMVDNFGIYARRYAITTEDYTVTVTSDNTTTTVTLPVRGVKEVGNEFRVSRPNPFSADADDKDQIGASVAMDSNGDMVFAWTDLSYPNEEGQNVESVVCVRSIVLPDDTTPPYVVRANAVYEKPAKDESSSGQMAQVSLYAQSVSFPSGNGPNSLVYGFNEYMYTAQMYSDIKAEEFEIPENYDDVYGYSAARALENKDVKSVIDINDWTLMKDGVVVTTAYIQDIIYGYNASTKTIEELAAYGIDLGENPYYKPYPKGYETNSDELVIIFSRPLPDGSYVLTLNDKVTDASGRNRLDGDYDGESGGSFTVRFQIGAPTADDSDYVPGEDSHAYTGMYGGEGVPVTAANSKGFVIVTEQQVLYELDGSSSSGTNNNNNNNNN